MYYPNVVVFNAAPLTTLLAAVKVYFTVFILTEDDTLVVNILFLKGKKLKEAVDDCVTGMVSVKTVVSGLETGTDISSRTPLT
jgi:hypothetical protein